MTDQVLVAIVFDPYDMALVRHLTQIARKCAHFSGSDPEIIRNIILGLALYALVHEDKICNILAKAGTLLRYYEETVVEDGQL